MSTGLFLWRDPFWPAKFRPDPTRPTHDDAKVEFLKILASSIYAAQHSSVRNAQPGPADSVLGPFFTLYSFSPVHCEEHVHYPLQTFHLCSLKTNAMKRVAMLGCWTSWRSPRLLTLHWWFSCNTSRVYLVCCVAVHASPLPSSGSDLWPMFKLYITAAGVLRVASTRIRWRCRPALSHLSARTLTGSLDQWRISFRRLFSSIL